MWVRPSMASKFEHPYPGSLYIIVAPEVKTGNYLPVILTWLKKGLSPYKASIIIWILCFRNSIKTMLMYKALNILPNAPNIMFDAFELKCYNNSKLRRFKYESQLR